MVATLWPTWSSNLFYFGKNSLAPVVHKITVLLDRAESTTHGTVSMKTVGVSKLRLIPVIVIS